ncbi:MAG: DMT family transporter, partial [Lachnospiraceae bacterium]|nr:DMT family transporter [Lachnospiraceae bacterium]
LLNTGAGCCLYFSSIRHLPVQSISVLGYLEPLSALILSVALLHEHFSLLQGIGAVLILGGAVLMSSGDFQRHPERQ